MSNLVGQLRISLGLDSAAFDAGVRQAKGSVNALGVDMTAAAQRMSNFANGLYTSGEAAQRMGGQLRGANDNSGQLKAGMQNLGFQLQDIAVQFASGQRAGTIFAQQLPQVAGAMTQIAQATGKTSGLLGSLAGFMSGPWGVAVGVGAAVLSPLITRLFDTGAAADDATAKLQTTAQAARNLVGAENGLALAQKQIELNKLRDRRLELENYIDRQPKNTATGQAMFAYAQQKELLAVRQQIMAQEAVVNKAEEENQKLLDNLDKATRPIIRSTGGSGGSSARRAGQDAGREYRSGLEDELRKLSQTTNDLEATVFKPLADRSKEQLSFRDSAAAKFLQEQLADVSKVVGYTGEQIQNTNRRIGDSFVEMTDRTLSSLQELSNGIRSGDFLSTLSGVIHLFGNLASTGLFGGKLASLFGSPNGRADGGPVSAGRMYMVGERGPELFLSKGPGTIVPNHNLRGSGGAPSSIQVVPSPYFDVVVDGRVIRAAPTIADAGGNLGFQRVARANSRRLA